MRVRLIPSFLALALGLVVPIIASAYMVAANAQLNAEDNGNCTATYYGTHWAQFSQVSQSDIGQNVGLQGVLQTPSAQVSSCAGGGVLTGNTVYFCATQWTHPCINTTGPTFQAKTLSGGITGLSGQFRLYCVEHVE